MALSRWGEEYRIRKAINRVGEEALGKADRIVHFFGVNGSLLVPRKQNCGVMRLEEGIG